ncbi:MAG: hypothetical protein P8H64_02240 [Flavobacteriaceae bacterium]|nr:hypothetical protein [Flavobacteriaceae bacterium]
MKKLLLLTALFVFACSSDDSSDTNDDNLNGGNNYFFEIIFGGETHRVEGNSISIIEQVGSSCFLNRAQASYFNGTLDITCRIEDITCDTYISGQYLHVGLIIDNPQLGNNQGRIVFRDTPFLQDYENLNNINLSSNQFYVENNPMNVSEASQNGLLNLITDINITDLGTSPSSFNLYDGATVKGSYNGVLYYNDTSNFNNTELVVPVPISISFEAFRID